MKKMVILASLFLVIPIKTMQNGEIYQAIAVQAIAVQTITVQNVQKFLYKYQQYFCPQKNCRYKNRRWSVMNNHISTHNIIKNNSSGNLRYHKCSVCDFLTLQKSTYTRHACSHQAKMFSCTLCQKKFKYIDSLYRHEKNTRIHNKKR